MKTLIITDKELTEWDQYSYQVLLEVLESKGFPIAGNCFKTPNYSVLRYCEIYRNALHQYFEINWEEKSDD